VYTVGELASASFLLARVAGEIGEVNKPRVILQPPIFHRSNLPEAGRSSILILELQLRFPPQHVTQPGVHPRIQIYSAAPI
jgi:hypothetical protein